MKTRNHSWGLPDRQEHATDRRCRVCGVVKRGRREATQFWTEYWRDGVRLDMRPDCVERAPRPAKQMKAAA